MAVAFWVLAHPDEGSLNHHLAEVGTEALSENGWEVDVHDLYADGFNPLLIGEGEDDVRREQERLRAADLLVLQFPLWWYSMPAMMKGWVDRVFESGFAFDVPNPQTGQMRKYGDGGLVGKRALAVMTAGDRPGSLGPRGISGGVEDVLWPLLHGTFFYTGMEALRPHLVAGANGLLGPELKALETSLCDRLAGIAEESPIDYLPMTDEFYDHSIKLHEHIAPGDDTFRAHLNG